MDEEMMDANTGHGGLSGPDEGSAYRSDSSSAAAYAHHPATQGYNEYSQGQVEAQQRRRQGRRASQQRAASMDVLQRLTEYTVHLAGPPEAA